MESNERMGEALSTEEISDRTSIIFEIFCLKLLVSKLVTTGVEDGEVEFSLSLVCGSVECINRSSGLTIRCCC